MFLTNKSIRLHRRVELTILLAALVAIVFSMIFLWTLLDRFEQAVFTTLVGHEVEEIMVDLKEDPAAELAYTASIKAFLRSRSEQLPIPHHLLELHNECGCIVPVGDKVYFAQVLDLPNDRLYIEFDITGISQYKQIFLVFLLVGSVILFLLLSYLIVWVVRKLLLPISDLAETVSTFNVDDSSTHIEERYRDYEVGLIARAFDEFREKIRGYIDREKFFTAAVSHELRNPISVMSSSVELLESNQLLEKQKPVIQRVKSSTNYMRDIVDSILFIARNSNEEFDKSIVPVDIDEVSRSVLDQFRDKAQKKGLQLEYQPQASLMVRVIESHIKIILSNLVDNAIFHTTTGKVTLTLFEQGISVTDTGSGIPAEEIGHIMDLHFHSADSQGLGLGLYVVNKICNIYDFQLSVESELDHSSRFTVTFGNAIIQDDQSYSYG